MQTTDTFTDDEDAVRELQIASVYREEVTRRYPTGSRKPTLDDYDGSQE